MSICYFTRLVPSVSFQTDRQTEADLIPRSVNRQNALHSFSVPAAEELVGHQRRSA